MASKSPTPLSAQTGLRATQAPQTYDRRAGEERRQIIQRYREQERRNQELRESEAQAVQANREQKYETYKAEAGRLNEAGEAQAAAAEAYNTIRDRFNAASPEEQRQLEPELRKRADEYNQASRRLEFQTMQYNASLLAAKNAGAIDRSAQTVNYKADIIKVQLQEVEQPTEPTPEPDLLTPSGSADPQRPTLSRPESPGVVQGSGLQGTGAVIYVPGDPETQQRIELTQTVTPVGGTLSTTYLLQETEPQAGPTLSYSDGEVVRGESSAVVGNKPWSVEEVGVPGAVRALEQFTDNAGKNLIAAGAASTAAGFDTIGALQIAAGKAIMDPVGAIQRIQNPPDPEKDAAEQAESIRGTASGLIAAGTVLNQGKEAGIGSPLIGIGRDMLSNIGYATEGIKVSVGDNGLQVDNLPSPLMLTAMGVATAGLGGLLGASGIAAAGFSNPLKAFSAPAALQIEGEAAASVIGGGGSTGGAGAVITAAETQKLTALGALGALYGGADIVRQEDTTGPWYSGPDIVRQENTKGPWYSGSDIVRQENKTPELTPGREADETVSEYARPQLLRQSEKDAVAAATAALSAGTAQQTTTRPSYVSDYIYGRPEISQDEYAKKNPFVEVTRNPYEFVRANETANANRFDAAYYYRGAFDTETPRKRIRLPDIDIEITKPKKKQMPKKKKRTDSYFYVTRELPTSKDLFGFKQQKSRSKKGSDLLTRKKKKQPKLF